MSCGIRRSPLDPESVRGGQVSVATANFNSNEFRTGDLNNWPNIIANIWYDIGFKIQIRSSVWRLKTVVATQLIIFCSSYNSLMFDCFFSMLSLALNLCHLSGKKRPWTSGCGTGPEAVAWDWQCCTEFQLAVPSNNVTDMFPPLKWNSDIVNK